MQELTNIGGISKVWVSAASGNEVRVWFSHPSQAIEEYTVINRVKHRGFISIRRNEEEWKIDTMYSTIRRQTGDTWGMSGLCSISDSARKKAIACCDYVIAEWISQNMDDIEDARIATFKKDLEVLEGRKADLLEELQRIKQEIADKAAEIDNHENGDAIAEITLSRAEGTIAEVDAPPAIVKSWEEANKVISRWAKTVSLGTNKVDCWVTWKNGEKYGYLLNMGQCHTNPNFRQDVLDSIRFNTGDCCPSHMTTEEYEQFTKVYLKPETRDRFRQLLSLFK